MEACKGSQRLPGRLAGLLAKQLQHRPTCQDLASGRGRPKQPRMGTLILCSREEVALCIDPSH